MNTLTFTDESNVYLIILTLQRRLRRLRGTFIQVIQEIFIELDDTHEKGVLNQETHIINIYTCTVHNYSFANMLMRSLNNKT